MLYLRGQDLGRKVGDVGRDGPARQELGHLVGEGVAVVLKQAIPVAPAAEQRTPHRSRHQFQFILLILWFTSAAGLADS